MMAAVWLIDGSADANARGRSAVQSMRSAFAVGWWWGFGYFVAGLWWLGAAFLVEADKFAWALPLGVLALPAGLAFFPALGFAIARLLWSPGSARVLALAVGLTASEALRALVLTGFPWNEIGMALGQNLVLAQFASIVGLHGLTILAIAIFAAPATLADEASGRWFTRPIVLAARRSGGACRFRRLSPVGARSAARRRREVAHHAAQYRAGRQFRAAEQRRDHAPLSRLVGPGDLADLDRRRRRHASDLARIGLSRFCSRATRKRSRKSPISSMAARL